MPRKTSASSIAGRIFWALPSRGADVPAARRVRAGVLDRLGWIPLGWLLVAAQAVGCGLEYWAHGWQGAAVLAVFAAISSVALGLAPKVPTLFGAIFAAASALNAAGWVWRIYDRVWWFDDALHFLTPLAVVGGLISAGLRSDRIAWPPTGSRFLAACTAAGLSIGLAWEGVEAIFIAPFVSDTLFDLAFDALGGACAGWLMWRARRSLTPQISPTS